MAYRYWCGECGYKTLWLTESDGAKRQIEHYERRHPGIPPGGQVEVNGRTAGGGGGGCLALLALGVLLLLAAASCHR
ncbi:hypothetical protein ACIRD3_05935 [Kitasatospora sp. NPDC093550]|uniref:hypothetical protein n=1 Tax=Kitasatospora sp. NPDC093550 TaxID=3364089 RepID=UPI003821FEAC